MMSLAICATVIPIEPGPEYGIHPRLNLAPLAWAESAMLALLADEDRFDRT
jgi:hypothetical protein